MADCMKCGGSMTEGFIVDHGEYGIAHVGAFQPGQPHKSVWTGVKQKKKEQVEITTYRCNRCGYLENYAKS